MERKDLNLLKYALSHPGVIPSFWRFGFGFKGELKKSYQNKQDISAAPAVLTLRPTFGCNAKCIMCNVWQKQKLTDNSASLDINTEKELSAGRFKELINEVACFRPHIYFSGGEPLLAEGLFDLIEFAVSKNLITSINTNCILLEEKAEELIRSGVHFIYASLEGTNDIHNKITRKPGGFTKVINGIKKVVELRRIYKRDLPNIQVLTVIMQENQYNLLEIARLVDKLGVEAFKLLLLSYNVYDPNPGGPPADNPPGDQICWKHAVPVSPEIDVPAVIRQIEEIAGSKWNFCFRPYDQASLKGLTLDDYYYAPEKIMKNYKCHTAWFFGDVYPNGDVVCCANLPFVAGNIKNSSFMEIWNGKKMREFRAVIKKSLPRQCSGCNCQMLYF